MIGQELGWDYIERVVDRGFFEDQLVQHQVTGLRAVRRLFSENFCADDIAVGTVRRQTEKSGSVQHPSIPAVFHVEDTGTQIAVYYEYISGEAFEKMTRSHQFEKPKAWSASALAIVRMLVHLRELGLGYDRLLLEDLVLIDGVVRIRNRWPIGDVDESETGGSPFLERMSQSPYGGVYAVEKRHLHADALNRLKNLLFFMASGQWEQNVSATIEKYNAEKARGVTVHKTPLGLEYEIEDVLMRLHDPAGERGLKGLEELQHALSQLAGGAKTARVQSSRSSQSPPSKVDTNRVSSAVPAPGSEWDSSGEIPLADLPGYDRQSAEQVRASADAARADRTEDAVPMMGSDTDSGIKPLPKEAEDDEDDDDRSYLYPSRTASGTSPALSPAPASSALESVESARRTTKPIRRPFNWGLWIRVVLIVVVASAAIGGGAIAVKLIWWPTIHRRPGLSTLCKRSTWTRRNPRTPTRTI